MTIQLRRRVKGPRQSVSADLVVSLGVTNKHKPNKVLTVRVSAQVMKRARWIAGDSIVADFDAPSTWKLQRVGDGTGNAVKADTRDKGRGSVRFTVDDDMAPSFGFGPDGAYACSLSAIDGETLVFQRD